MNARAQFRFRLYVAGDTLNSAQAIANLNIICQQHLAGRHHIEVVDIIREPKRALDDRVFMTPTLAKLAPGSVQRIAGTLSDTNTVLYTLGLDARAA